MPPVEDGLQGRELVRVLDAAVISWPAERQAPRIRQAINLVGAGALGGTFWGMLVGLIFLCISLPLAELVRRFETRLRRKLGLVK